MPNTARRSELILRTIRPWQQSALSLKIACVYWKRRKLNPIAIGRYPRHDERINGGFNGLEDRSSYIRKAKEALVRIEGHPNRRCVRSVPGAVQPETRSATCRRC
jgi:hypothetical protein